MDVAEHVHRGLYEEATRLVLKDGPRSGAEPQHVPRKLDRGQVGGVLLRCLLVRVGGGVCSERAGGGGEKKKTKEDNKEE